MLRHKISGAAVVVMHEGRVLKTTSYGLANVETGEKVTSQTAFFIASITKAFTAAMVFSLVEEGRLNLSDSVGAFVTGLPTSWRGATIDQLLAMTSGTPDTAVHAGRGIPFPDYAALIAAAGRQPKRPFDEARVYGGTDYVLLGKIIEATTKK